MNVLGQFLDQRDGTDLTRGEHAREARKQQDIAWMSRGVAPEVRLLSFDTWARQELATRLDWAWAGTDKARRIEQARICLERLVLDLWRRGWMLDGKALADRITKMLDSVATQQQAGKVRDFWPYFQSSIQRYVGSNAEEIKDQAMRAGSHIQQALAVLATIKAPALPELVAQRAGEVSQAKSLRQKLAAQRKHEACKATADQAQLGL